MRIATMAALAGLAVLGLGRAEAAVGPWSGYAIADVNERSGPSTVYPSITVVPAGAPIVIYGCLADETWCDISWGPNRGWMSAAYIQVAYDSQPVPLPDYIAPLGIPFVSFDFDTYWGDYYRDRPFYHDSYRWRRIHPDHFMQPPPPPPGFFPPHHFDGQPPFHYERHDHDFGPNGYPPNGYPPNGNPPNGYPQNGYPQNGNPPNGYPQNGQGNSFKPHGYKPFENGQQSGPLGNGYPPNGLGHGPGGPQGPDAGKHHGCHIDNGQWICP